MKDDKKVAIISASRTIDSSVDKVWDIISDIDNDPEFWHGTKTVKNIRREGNVTERETIIAFRKSICKEIVTLHTNRQVLIEITEGPIIGKKIIELEKFDEKKSKIIVTWNIQLKGSMRLFTFMVKKHIQQGTEDALNRIEEKLK